MRDGAEPELTETDADGGRRQNCHREFSVGGISNEAIIGTQLGFRNTGEPACKVFSAVSSFLVGTNHNQLYWVIALM